MNRPCRSTGRRLWGLWTVLSLTALLGLNSARCSAHPASIAAATVHVQPDGQFQIQARFDLLAFALNDTPYRIGDAPMNALLDGPTDALQQQLTDAERRYRKDVQVSGGSSPATIDSVQFPTVADVQHWRDSGVVPRLPVMMTVTVRGHLPPDAISIAIRLPDVLGTVVVTTELPHQEPISEPVEGGAFSTPVSLAAPPPVPAPPPAALAPPPAAPVPPPAPMIAQAPPKPPSVRPRAAATVRAAPREKPVPSLREASLPKTTPMATPQLVPRPEPKTHRPETKPVVTSQAPRSVTPQAMAIPRTISQKVPAPARPGWFTVVGRYIQMGFLHILPEGLDHILFVLGLFLLSTRLKALLWQITAFTVAHSLTLALSLYGVFRLSPAIVEPIIAASIAFVAIENLTTSELKPWRPLVVFLFGLVHGMGFAGALRDLGLPRHDYLTALLGFNVGVELGQLSVVALALLAVGWLRSRPVYRRLIVVPGSLAIAVVAVFWTIQRLA